MDFAGNKDQSRVGCCPHPKEFTQSQEYGYEKMEAYTPNYKYEVIRAANNQHQRKKTVHPDNYPGNNFEECFFSAKKKHHVAGKYGFPVIDGHT